MIGERLREERERLGFSQPAFASLAETTKKSQIDYEKSISFPKANYLEVIAKAGADVQYIITGNRSLNLSSSLESICTKLSTLKPQQLDLLIKVVDLFCDEYFKIK